MIQVKFLSRIQQFIEVAARILKEKFIGHQRVEYVVITNVVEDDELTRFIVRSKDIKGQLSIKYTAFMPYIPKSKTNPELSLFCTTKLTPSIIWEQLTRILQKTPKGRGILKASSFYENKLRFALTTDVHPLHVDAVDWPDDKGHKILIAKKLSKSALLEINPNPN